MERFPARRWPAVAATAATALALFIVPWTLRNQAALGEPIWLRSNFGLELALANHPGAVDPVDPAQVFRDRLQEIHPFPKSGSGYARMQAAGGEVRYARQLGQETQHWIASNPGAFAQLTLRHAREFFFPPAWLWEIYGPFSSARQRSVMHTAIAAAGLFGAAVALAAAWRRYRFAVIMLVVPAMPYFVLQPILRYRYIIFGLLIMFAFDLAARLLKLQPRPLARAQQLAQ